MCCRGCGSASCHGSADWCMWEWSSMGKQRLTVQVGPMVAFCTQFDSITDNPLSHISLSCHPQTESSAHPAHPEAGPMLWAAVGWGLQVAPSTGNCTNPLHSQNICLHSTTHPNTHRSAALACAALVASGAAPVGLHGHHHGLELVHVGLADDGRPLPCGALLVRLGRQEGPASGKGMHTQAWKNA